MKRKTIALIAVVLLAGLAGCSTEGGDSTGQEVETPASSEGEVVAGEDNYKDGTFRRYVDEEAGVVCYEKSMPSGTGIDCMPLEQTGLVGGGF